MPEDTPTPAPEEQTIPETMTPQINEAPAVTDEEAVPEDTTPEEAEPLADEEASTAPTFNPAGTSISWGDTGLTVNIPFRNQ